MPVSILYWGAQHWTLLHVCPHQCQEEGQDHLPRPAGSASPRYHRSYGGAHCWLVFDLVSRRTPSSSSTKLFPPGWPPACPGGWGCAPIPAAGLCISIVGLQEIALGPLFSQSGTLRGSIPVRFIRHPSLFYKPICKLAEGILCPIV